jgi:hypothetical protein
MVQGPGRHTKIAYFEDMLKANLGMAKHGIARKRRRIQLGVEIRWLLSHLGNAVLVQRCAIAQHNMLSMGLSSLLNRESRWC